MFYKSHSVFHYGSDQTIPHAVNRGISTNIFVLSQEVSSMAMDRKFKALFHMISLLKVLAHQFQFLQIEIATIGHRKKLNNGNAWMNILWQLLQQELKQLNTTKYNLLLKSVSFANTGQYKYLYANTLYINVWM